MTDNKDFVADPWWKTGFDDYTRSRSTGVSYTVDDLIGRKDYKKYILTTEDSETTMSGIEDARIISAT